MGQMLVRNLEDDVIERLRQLAKSEGVSLEEVSRRALRAHARPCQDEIIAAVESIRALSSPSDADSTSYIREMRDRAWRGD